jgi:frataxin-like iron-binding protein CyaY
VAAEVDLPQADRIQLAHALIEHLAVAAGIDLLHIKGYAAHASLYEEGRVSSDVDLLVRPRDAARLADVLLADGWEAVTSFRTGSVFQHAMTLWNEQWGHVDVHRSFPGVGLEPEPFFELLWAHRDTTLIAGRPCRVPGLQHQALLIVLHAARDPHRGASDVDFVGKALGREEWERLEVLAEEVGASITLAAATGGLAAWQGHPDHDIWRVASRGGTRVELFRARWRASRSGRERWALLRGLLVVNRDHLRMKLLREPRPADYAVELRERVREAVRSLMRRRPTL